MRRALSARARTALLGAVLAGSGCGELLDADRFGPESGDCPDGQRAGSGSRCVPEPECGSVEVVNAQGKCVAVAVADCGEQFVADPDHPGACTPLLPECSGVSVARLGAINCERVASCSGSLLPPNAATQQRFVDATAAAGGDGSRESPWASLQEGLAEAPEGEVELLVLPGEYQGPVVVERPIRIGGLCTAETHILPGTDGAPALTVGQGANGSFIHRLSIDGAGSVAMRIEAADDVVLQDIIVENPEGVGIEAVPLPLPSEAGEVEDVVRNLRITESIVRVARGAGIAAYGVDGLKIEGAVIVNVQSAPGVTGAGIALRPSPFTALSDDPSDDPLGSARTTNASIVASRVEAVEGAGILVEGSDATISRSVVRDVYADSHGVGRGIAAQPHVSIRKLQAIPAATHPGAGWRKTQGQPLEAVPAEAGDSEQTA